LFFAVPYDAKKTDLRWVVEATNSLADWNLTIFDSATQFPPLADGWREFSAGNLVAPGQPLFFRLKLETVTPN
jgi:hypothetical protein